jgi:hypothetical protein
MDQLRAGLGFRASEAEVRAALKRLGARAHRMVNAWPTLKRNVQTCYEARNYSAQRFTVYSLGGAK